MMEQILGHQPVNTFPQAMDGRVKTLLCLMAVVIVVVLRHWYMAAIPLFAAAILLFRQKYSLKMLLLRLIIPFGVAWLVLVSFLLTYGHTEIGCFYIWRWAFPMYLEGLQHGIIITIRLLAAVCIVTLLSLITPMTEILATMRLVRVPGLIVDLAEMIWRYIALMDETAHSMRNAQVSRGADSLPWYQQAYDIGILAGMLMIKALDRSTRIYKAMLSRGFDESNDAHPFFEGGFSRQNLIVLLWGMIAILAWLATDLILR